MGCRRFARRWVCLLGLPAAAGGCHTTAPPTVPVLVRDAETKRPVAGAAVRLWCPDPRGPDLGAGAAGTTAADGVARVSSAAPPGVALVVGVTAPEYLPDEADFHGPAVGPEGKGPVAPAGPVVVEVFTGPRPVVDLIVPTGYRNLVKVEVRIDDGPGPPGRRAFQFPVSPAGVATVVGPPILAHGPGPTFTAHYADGTPLPVAPEGLQIGFRWLRCEGTTQYFVVGTQAEWAAARRLLDRDPPPAHGGQKGGGGRGGHRGGGRGGRGGM